MKKSTRVYKEYITDLKRLFDDHNVKRMNVEDSFFMEIINIIENKNIKDSENTYTTNVQVKEKRDITDIKMELMVNVEGLITNMKGQTKGQRITFGLDARNKGLSLFLASAKLLVRDKPFSKHDVLVFYDDSALKTGSKGFAITRDEIITNMAGLFKLHRFKEMEAIPEYIQGLKKDVIRVYLEGTSFDIKINKKAQNKQVAFQISKILYNYGVEVMNEK